MDLKVRVKLTRGMSAPQYESETAAAVDLRAALEEGEVVTLAPGGRARIPTGVALSPERRDVVAIIAGRSGHGLKHGVTLANSIGVIDSDYRGEISVVLVNHGPDPVEVRRGDRIAQMMFVPIYTAAFLPVDELDETARGAGGFGHTGVK